MGKTGRLHQFGDFIRNVVQVKYSEFLAGLADYGYFCVGGGIAVFGNMVAVHPMADDFPGFVVNVDQHCAERAASGAD
jgi:hypothetical protein